MYITDIFRNNSQKLNMPVNMWNFFRAVGTSSDQKTWLSDNPQVRIRIQISEINVNIINYRLRMDVLEAMWNFIRKYAINTQMKLII